MRKSGNKGLILLVAVVSGLFIFQSCLKDKFDFDKLSTDATWAPSLAVPVAHGILNVYDIVSDFDSTGLINFDDEGLVYLEYDKKVASLRGADLIDVPDQTFNYVFAGSNADPFSGGSTNMVSQTLSSFDVNDQERLDSIVFKGSTKLIIDVSSTFLHEGTLVISFPELKKNGTSYSKTVNINTTSGGFVYHGEYIDLDGYSLDLSNLGIDTNKVLINYDLTLYDSGSNTINPSNYTLISTSFSNIEFKAMYGYIGYRELDMPMDSLHIDMFDNEFDGAIYFRNPQFKIYTNNSYGLPIKFGFTTLESYSTIYETNIDVVGTDIPMAGTNPQLLAYPTLNQVGESKLDSITLDGNNSNIDQVVSNFPKYIYFAVDAAANFDDTYTNSNFALDTSHFDVDINVQLPLWGNARYFRLADTVDADMHEVVDSNEIIDQLIFRMISLNGMPFEAAIQGYFVDSLYNVIDSLITTDDQYIIESGVIDSETDRVDQATGTTMKISDFIYPAERIAKLQDVRYVIFRSRAYTTNWANSQNIKIYSDYTIQLKLGLRIDAEISTSDNLDF